MHLNKFPRYLLIAVTTFLGVLALTISTTTQAQLVPSHRRFVVLGIIKLVSTKPKLNLQLEPRKCLACLRP